MFFIWTLKKTAASQSCYSVSPSSAFFVFSICTDYIQSCILLLFSSLNYKALTVASGHFIWLYSLTFPPQSCLKLVFGASEVLKALLTEQSATANILTTTAASRLENQSQHFFLFLSGGGLVSYFLFVFWSTTSFSASLSSPDVSSAHSNSSLKQKSVQCHPITVIKIYLKWVSI